MELRLTLAKLLMEVEEPADAYELLQNMRLEDEVFDFSHSHPFPPYVTPHFPYISQSTYFFEDSLEIWYLLACAALQADETSIALEELKRAIAHGESEACAPSEKGLLTQLVELRGEAEAAAAAQR